MSGKPLEIGANGQAFARRVKLLREERGMTYTDLSDALSRDINPVGIRRIEDCERRVGIDDVFSLAQALGVSPLELMGLNGNSFSATSLRKLRGALTAALEQLDQAG